MSSFLTVGAGSGEGVTGQGISAPNVIPLAVIAGHIAELTTKILSA